MRNGTLLLTAPAPAAVFPEGHVGGDAAEAETLLQGLANVRVSVDSGFTSGEQILFCLPPSSFCSDESNVLGARPAPAPER